MYRLVSYFFASRSGCFSLLTSAMTFGVLALPPASGQEAPRVAAFRDEPVAVEFRQRSTFTGQRPLSGPLPERDRQMLREEVIETSRKGLIDLPPPPQSSGSLAPSLGTSFEGIPDTGFRPADPHLAVGPNQIVQVVNSSLRVTNRSGGAARTAELDDIFGIPAGGTFLFDPVCSYDHFADRFVVLTITRNSANTDGWYILAVTKTGTPSTSGRAWNVYYLRNDIDFPNTNTNNWGDYEKLGFDNTNFYITSNQFSPSDLFQYAKIRIYPKRPIYNGQSVGGSEFSDVRDASNNRVFTIQPAVTFGTPGQEYLASCTSGAGSSIALFSIGASTLTLNRRSINVSGWMVPESAGQQGSDVTLDSGDARLQNAVFRNNRFYTTHTVKTGDFPCACQFIGVNTSTNTISLDVTIGFPSASYYYPAVTVTSNGTLGTVFNFSATDRYPGIAYTQISAGGSIQPLGLLNEGKQSYTVNSNGRVRWGDYNGIAIDPRDSNRVWFNAMYAGAANKWGTFVGSTNLSNGRTGRNNEALLEALTSVRDRLIDQAKSAAVFGQAFP